MHDFFSEAVSCSNPLNVDLGRPLPPFPASGGVHVEVRYQPDTPHTALMDVWLSYNDGSFPRTMVLSAPGPKLDGEVFLGFTAAGGRHEFGSTQEVDDLRIGVLDCLPPGTTPDCNGNGVSDLVEIIFLDCNGTDVPDECDIAAGVSEDCNSNGVPDECEHDRDCNANFVPDECDMAAGAQRHRKCRAGANRGDRG